MDIGERDDREDGFNKRSPFVRFIVLFAGVFMNFVLAYFIIFGMILNQGEVVLNPNPVVGRVSKFSKDTFKKGDKILEIENVKIKKWQQLSPSLTLITINVNVLNSPIKRHRLAEWI